MEIEGSKPVLKRDFLIDENIFQIYYKHFFPATEMVQWLSYENYGQQEGIKKEISFFTKREFSFTYPGDIYQRYQSYRNEDHLRQTLVENKPEKIDIGAVFEQIPNKNQNIKPQQREFVIDIDMTDYDEVRTCCQDANICHKCWEFMKAAGHVLFNFMTQSYGFENILWVYSGRRGIHLWVCEESVRKMNNEKRSAVIDNLNLVQGSGDNLSLKKGMIHVIDHKHFMHPYFKSATQVLSKYFLNIERQQQIFVKKPQIIQTILKNRDVENGEALWNNIQRKWQNINNSEERLKILLEQIEKHNKEQEKNAANQIHFIKEEIMMVLFYPRLDVNVSKSMNHLLKAPFSLHPKTGRVCVPFTDKQFDTFDPFQSPHMEDLYNYQIKKEKCLKEQKEFNETNPMEEYVKIMQDFVKQVSGVHSKTQRIQKQVQNRMELEDGSQF